jgi:hypothetical protein
MQILTINTTARDACINGDLTIATRLLTQCIRADGNDHNSHANRSFVEARNSNWDCALDDSLKVIHRSVVIFLTQTNLYGDIEHQYSAILDGLYLQGHRPLWKTTVPGRDESI